MRHVVIVRIDEKALHLELGDRAPQPEIAARGVDQANRNEPGRLPPVLRLNDQVRHRTSDRVDDRAAYLATDRPSSRCRHAVLYKIGTWQFMICLLRITTP